MVWFSDETTESMMPTESQLQCVDYNCCRSHLIILSFLTEITFPGKVILNFLLKTSEIFQFKN